MTQPNWADMLPGESLLAWLTRTDTDREWAVNPDSGLLEARLGPIGTDEHGFTLRPVFAEEWWGRERDRVLGIPPPQPLVPPIWPGADKVTLGEPVSLAPSLTITTPMDGILVSITATNPSFTYFYTYDGLKGYRSIGSLTFLTDSGQAEPFHALNFEQAVYCPRTMRRAQGVKMFTDHGLVGTVTPWTITGA